MKCKEIEILISAYADQEATDEESRAVEDHLKVCEVCRKTLSEFSGMHTLYQGMAPKEPLPGFRQRVTQRLEKSPRLGHAGLWWRQMRPAYVISFALLLLGAAVISLQVTRPPALVAVDVYAEDILFDQAGFIVDDIFSLEGTSIADEIADMFYFDEADKTLFFGDETPSQDNVTSHSVNEWYV